MHRNTTGADGEKWEKLIEQHYSSPKIAQDMVELYKKFVYKHRLNRAISQYLTIQNQAHNEKENGRNYYHSES